MTPILDFERSTVRAGTANRRAKMNTPNKTKKASAPETRKDASQTAGWGAWQPTDSHSQPLASKAATGEGDAPRVYCEQVKYCDGDTLSVSAVATKPRETICLLLEMKRQRDELQQRLVATESDLSAALGRMNEFQTQRNDVWKMHDKAAAQRDELLAALKQAETLLQPIRAAIAKAEQTHNQ